ncbi:MAG: hypothetical protein ACI88G_002060 [Woeseiaceae bacterium]|jgi:hypothetical protein
MSKRVACFLTPLLLAVVPTVASAVNVCDLLNVGNASPPATYPNTVTSLTPNVSELVIQIYSTKTVDAADPGGTANKCAIAQDLWEVDRMMKDVGFDGYPNDDSAALFDNARVMSIQLDSEKEIVREVVRAILDPGGEAEPAIQALTGNGALYDAKILNVYYVDPDDELMQTGFDYVSRLTGMHIRNNDGYSERMIFVSDSAKSDTVAHEFAHAFSAGHVNFWGLDGEEYCIKFLPHPGTATPDINMECEFPKENYMWAASDGDRAELIDAQKVRMMRNEHSVIFNYSPPTNKLNCPDFNSDPNKACPRMGL